MITGGAGFIGSHLCEHFLERGDEVEAVDNFLTGSRDNVARLADNPSFRLVEHDITTPYFPESPPDLVLHFASPASPPQYLANPIHTLKVGGLGALHALGIAKASGSRFVLASTSEVYGDPTVSCPDISKAKAALGWWPQVGLEDGLARTVDWFRTTV